MPTRQILREKLAGVWRLILVAAVPMMTAWGLIAYVRYSVGGDFSNRGVLFLGLAASVTLTHLALTAYISLLVGLRVPTQSRAVLLSVAILTAMCLAGPIIRLVSEAGGADPAYDRRSPGLSLYSPASVLGELLDTRADAGTLFLLLVGNTAVYGGLALTLRWACYRNAGAWLGRDENEPAPSMLEQLAVPRMTAPAPEGTAAPETFRPAETIG